MLLIKSTKKLSVVTIQSITQQETIENPILTWLDLFYS